MRQILRVIYYLPPTDCNVYEVWDWKVGHSLVAYPSLLPLVEKASHVPTNIHVHLKLYQPTRVLL